MREREWEQEGEQARERGGGGETGQEREKVETLVGGIPSTPPLANNYRGYSLSQPTLRALPGIAVDVDELETSGNKDDRVLSTSVRTAVLISSTIRLSNNVVGTDSVALSWDALDDAETCLGSMTTENKCCKAGKQETQKRRKQKHKTSRRRLHEYNEK